MPLIIGVTAGGVLVPVRVSASGVVKVSADISSLPSLPAGTNNIGDVDVASLPALPAGTNNIGDVDIVSLPALAAGTNNIGDVDVLTLPALPAGDNNIGNVDVVTLPALPTGGNVIGKVQALNYGWVDGVFQKSPIRMGYSALDPQQVLDEDASTNQNTLITSSVQPGEIWVLEAASARDNDHEATNVFIYVNVNAVNVTLAFAATLAAKAWLTWSGAVTMDQGDNIRVQFNDCTADDDLALRCAIRRIDIDQ